MEDDLIHMVYELVPGTVQSYSNFAVGVLGKYLEKLILGINMKGMTATKNTRTSF